MSKNRRKRRKSVTQHVSNLTLAQQGRLMGLVETLKESKPNRRSRRSRRSKNPEQKYSGFHVSERISPRMERKSTLFDALREGSEYRLIDELDELEQLKNTTDVLIDPRLSTEIENRIDEIKEELPASLLLSMTDDNLRENLKNLRTRESQRAAKKYSRRRILSTRERMRAFLAAIIVMGYTPLSSLTRVRATAGPAGSPYRSVGYSGVLDDRDNETIRMLAQEFSVPIPDRNSMQSWFEQFVSAIPIDLSKIKNGASNDGLFLGGRTISSPIQLPDSDYSYGGELADAVLLALPPESIREARERLDQMVEPNFVTSMGTAAVLSRIKRAKQRLDALMGSGRIINTAKHFARRALNPRGRRRNPQSLGDVSEESLSQSGIGGTLATAAIGGTLGYVGTGVVRSLVDILLATLVKDDRVRGWVSAVASPLITSGIAAWGAEQMADGNAKKSLAFVVAGSGARALHDVGDLTISPKDATYRFIRESVGLRGYPSMSGNTHGYSGGNSFMSGYSMTTPAMHGYQY